MAKNEWLNWLKCNILEIVILVLVLVLLVKAFSGPVPVEEVSTIPLSEELAVSEETPVEAAPAAEIPIEKTLVEEAPAKEVPAKETPKS